MYPVDYEYKLLLAWTESYRQPLREAAARLEAKAVVAEAPATITKSDLVAEVAIKTGLGRNGAGNRVNTAIAKCTLVEIRPGVLTMESAKVFLATLKPKQVHTTADLLDF